ncbi:MAG: hypothetical protein R2719_02945 [Micropruina sp.]
MDIAGGRRSCPSRSAGSLRSRLASQVACGSVGSRRNRGSWRQSNRLPETVGDLEQRGRHRRGRGAARGGGDHLAQHAQHLLAEFLDGVEPVVGVAGAALSSSRYSESYRANAGS